MLTLAPMYRRLRRTLSQRFYVFYTYYDTPLDPYSLRPTGGRTDG